MGHHDSSQSLSGVGEGFTEPEAVGAAATDVCNQLMNRFPFAMQEWRSLLLSLRDGGALLSVGIPPKIATQLRKACASVSLLLPDMQVISPRHCCYQAHSRAS